MPTVNQAARNPRPPGSFVPATGRSMDCAKRSTVATRPVAFRVVLTSVIGPGSFSAWTTVFPVTGTGPQSWYGETVSYGSGTETRYGIGLPIQFAADSVCPPEVDEKYVVAT